LRLLVESPYYSKYALGIPGVLITIFVILWCLQVLQYAGIVVALLFGIALIVKGFRIDQMLAKQTKNLRKLMLQPHGQLRVYTLIAGVVIFFVAGYKATAYIVEAYEIIPFPPTSAIIADFIQQAIPLLILGAFIQLMGTGIYYYFTRNAKFWHTIIGLIFITITYPIAFEISFMIRDPAHPIQSLAYWLVIGISVVIISLLFVRGLRRTKVASSYFRRGRK
jgi:putative membrane protein